MPRHPVRPVDEGRYARTQQNKFCADYSRCRAIAVDSWHQQGTPLAPAPTKRTVPDDGTRLRTSPGPKPYRIFSQGRRVFGVVLARVAATSARYREDGAILNLPARRHIDATAALNA